MRSYITHAENTNIIISSTIAPSVFRVNEHILRQELQAILLSTARLMTGIAAAQMVFFNGVDHPRTHYKFLHMPEERHTLSHLV